ncbi:MAG TPA: hypothetical protein PLW65_33060, partial [Pseudomonadota bacterium]|nr:hypothetical protein [Pseudomonadota bacterium]
MALVFPAGVTPSPEPAGAAAVVKELRGGPSTSPLSEEELRSAALRGDCASWSALIARHNHQVVVSLLGRGLNL